MQGQQEEQRTILLVEDEAVIAMIEEQALKRHGFNVIVASSGEKAINIVKNTKDIDLILMDINLGKGKMDGTEAAEIILKDNDIPVLFLSSYTQVEVVQKREQLTSYGYVVKDSGETVLITSINMAFKLSDAHQRLKKREEELQESEKKYRQLVDTLQEGIWLIDKDSNTSFVNPRMAEMLGYTVEEMLGKPIFSFMDKRGVEIAKIGIDRGKQNVTEQMDFELIRKDGNRIYTTLAATPMVDEKGNYVGSLAGVNDITKRRRAEDAAKENHLQMLSIMDANTEPVYVADPETYELLYVNKALVDAFGEPEHRKCYEHFQKRKSPCTFCTNDKILGVNFGKTFVWETQNKTNRRWYRCLDRAITWPDGRAVRYEMAIDMTEHKLAEEALRENEDWLRTILKTAMDGFWLADMQGHLLEVNDAYCRMSGYGKEELLNMTISDVEVEEKRTEIAAHLQKVMSHGEDRFETTHRRKDGSLMELEISVQYKSYREGRTVAFLRDITERKRVEDELKSANIKLESLWNVSSLSGATTKIISDHILESITRMMQSEYGFYGFINDDESVMIIHSWSGEAMKDCSMVDKPQHFPINEAGVWAEAIRRREPFIFNNYAATDMAKKGLPEGHVELTNLMVVPHFTKDRITSVVAVANRHANYSINDVTQITAFLNSVQTIVDSKQAEEAVRESQQRLTDIIEFLPDATLVIDKNGKVIAWNRAIEAMTGVRAEAILGKNNYEYSLPFFGERKPILIDIALHSEMTRGKSYTTIHREGDIVFGEAYTPALAPGNIHLSGTASVLRNSNGEIVGAIECIRNNTERKNMEERLQRAEKMEALGLLAGGVAHDLNNALGIFVGYSELLYDGLAETDPLREDAKNIMKGGEQAAAIVQDLLTLARRGVQTKTVININKTVNEYLKSHEYLKLKSLHSTVRIKTELEGEILKIAGSPVHLSKTLNNLISNAAEAMPSGGDIVIHTENRYVDRPVSGYDTVLEGDYVVLRVTDEGEGITDVDMKRIFEPFYTKKVMGRSGTGLGLAVVWGTVKDHNGYIDVQSRRGEGTTFSLYFPVSHEEIAEDKVTLPDEYMGHGEKILVVDDIKDQRVLAIRILSNLSYQVEVVASGEEAVEYLKSKEADLIVLDMIMDPGIDGLETYRQISEIRPRQKAIIVSGFAETERVKMTQSLGAGTFVKKPYVRERLGMALRRELDRK